WPRRARRSRPPPRASAPGASRPRRPTRCVASVRTIRSARAPPRGSEPPERNGRVTREGRLTRRRRGAGRARANWRHCRTSRATGRDQRALLCEDGARATRCRDGRATRRRKERPMKHNANGIDIHYEIEGEGPVVTFSHSLACHLGMWDAQVEALKNRYRVLRFDTRGHGQTSAPAGAYTLEQMAEDFRGLLDGLGIRETHFVGLSMGGMIGQVFAL